MRLGLYTKDILCSMAFRRGVVQISNAEVVDIDGANEIENKHIQLASIAFKSKHQPDL